jgi:hypothetical protein
VGRSTDDFRCILVSAIILSVVGCPPALAIDADSDTTPVLIYNRLPDTAGIEVLSKSDALSICRAMGLLDGVRVEDIRAFSKCAAVLSHEGYEGSNSDIAKQLVQVVRLRGLYAQPDRWLPTLDIVARAYQAFNSVVAPSDIIASFLRDAGPDASKALSDEGS